MNTETETETIITSEASPLASGEICVYTAHAGRWRGRSFRTDGGAQGIYVGTTPHGCQWFAYDPAEFLPLCEAFDRLYAPLPLELTEHGEPLNNAEAGLVRALVADPTGAHDLEGVRPAVLERIAEFFGLQ